MQKGPALTINRSPSVGFRDGKSKEAGFDGISNFDPRGQIDISKALKKPQNAVQLLTSYL